MWGGNSASANTPLIAGERTKPMATKKNARQESSRTLPKALTGINGLDEITGGGLPRGRPTLVSGGAGSG